MGTRSESGQEIDVRSSFAVPHAENEDQIAVDGNFQQEMQKLVNQTGTKEQIVGWYAPFPLNDMSWRGHFADPDRQVRNASRHQRILGFDPELLHERYLPFASCPLDSRHGPKRGWIRFERQGMDLNPDWSHAQGRELCLPTCTCPGQVRSIRTSSL